MAAMAQILIEEKLGFHVLTQKGPGWAKRYSTSAISCTLISSNIINVIHTHIYIYTVCYIICGRDLLVLLSDPICFHTCLLVCSQLVSLFLYLHCDSSVWVLSVKGISLSPVLTSLHCSVFFVLVALGTGLKSHLFSYSSLYFTLTCGCSLWVLPGHSMLLVLCLSPRLPPLFSPTRAPLTSISLSCCSSL